MKFIFSIILLLTAPTVFAQSDATSSSDLNLIDTSVSTQSASESSNLISTPSATPSFNDEIKIEELNSAIIDEETIKTAILYTGIMMLILLAFIAGKKSSELDKSED